MKKICIALLSLTIGFLLVHPLRIENVPIYLDIPFFLKGSLASVIMCALIIIAGGRIGDSSGKKEGE
jgi:hypothetical protein